MLVFATVSFLMFVTPGPGVLSLAGVGAAFGWRRGLLYMAGLFLGHVIVSVAVITGLALFFWRSQLCAQFSYFYQLLILAI